MKDKELIAILEAILMASSKPLSVDNLLAILSENSDNIDVVDLPLKLKVLKTKIVSLLSKLALSYKDRGIELKEVSSGFRFQIKAQYSSWVSKLWDEKPQKYSRALMETLVLIAYRQPITRGDIEDIRGVAVSSQIVRTLLDREWIRVIGHRDVPGKPAMYATTKQFLDYFSLTKLDELPSLSELIDIDIKEV